MSYTIRDYPASPNNYEVGRDGFAISEILIHHAASTSFDSIGQTFSNPARRASAHYGVGRNQNVDRYVHERNIAWHCGNYLHNRKSVGIENVNSSGAPNWSIAPETFETLVELCADIVRRNPAIGKLEVGRNLFGHKDVSDNPTACPFALHSRLQELANRVNALVSGAAPSPAPSTGKKSNEQIADEVMAGSWGNNPERAARLAAAGYDYRVIQSIVNSRVGASPTAPRKSNDTVANEVLAGAWGNGDDRKARLSAAGYDFGTIQNLVNQKLGGTPAAAPAPARPSVSTIADQVIAGAWGNNPERAARLRASGFDANAVQAEVNRKLGIGAAAPARKSEDQIANEIIAGQGGWGNNPERSQKLTAAGYNAASVQSIVNRKLGF